MLINRKKMTIIYKIFNKKNPNEIYIGKGCRLQINYSLVGVEKLRRKYGYDTNDYVIEEIQTDKSKREVINDYMKDENYTLVNRYLVDGNETQEENKQRWKKYRKTYYENNKPLIREINDRYIQNNLDKVKTNRKLYYLRRKQERQKNQNQQPTNILSILN